MNEVASPAHTPAASPITASRGFVDWLVSQDVSLAISTYQTGKLFVIGHNQDGRFSVFDRTFERPMGLAGNDKTIFMASLYQLWRLENVLPPGMTTEGYDRSFVPQVGFTTGDLNVHDVALDREGIPHFICSRFSCLATPSERYNFQPLWMPKFISKLAGEDRCHLNGLAMVDGKPRYVTACSQTDIVDGWREHRGWWIVIDIDSDEIVGQGFSMPHSPRWYRNRLWLLDAGTGYFGYLDLASGKFERVTFCPGFARGLTFAASTPWWVFLCPDTIPPFRGCRCNRTWKPPGIGTLRAVGHRSGIGRCGEMDANGESDSGVVRRAGIAGREAAPAGGLQNQPNPQYRVGRSTGHPTAGQDKVDSDVPSPHRLKQQCPGFWARIRPRHSRPGKLS